MTFIEACNNIGRHIPKLSPRFLRVTKFKIRVTNLTISVISVFHNKALKSETKHVLKLIFILLKSFLHIPIEIEHHQLS